MADRFDAEIDRVRQLLRLALVKNCYPIRQLERKAGVTPGLFRKTLGGEMRLSYRHVLQMVDAIGLPWSRFFRAAYPVPGETAPSLGLGAAAPRPPAAAPAPEARARESEIVSSEGRRMLIALCQAMIRLGNLSVRDLFDDVPPPWYPNNM